MNVLVLVLLVLCRGAVASSARGVGQVLDTLFESPYVTAEAVSYLKYRYLGGTRATLLMGLVSRRGHDVYHDLLYAHNSYITADLVRNAPEICEIVYGVAEQVYREFLENKFLFFPKLEFAQVAEYARLLENVDHIVDSALYDDRRSAESFYDMLDKGFIDIREYVGVLDKLVQKGVPKAASVMGELYMYGHGVERNWQRAEEYFVKGAVRGEAVSYNGLGRILMDRDGESMGRCRQHLVKAVLKGLPAACFNMFLWYEKSHRGAGVQLGTVYLMKAAEKGYLPALFRYGEILYEQGRFDAAIPYLMSVSEYSSPVTRVQRDAEVLFLGGSHEKALALCLLGAEMGSDVSIKNALHLLKRHRRFVQDSASVVFRLLAKYVDMGVHTHLVDLGDCYFYGAGVEKSYKSAFAYYTSASLYDSGRGLYSLSYMYQHGLGCKRNPLQALHYVLQVLKKDADAYLVGFYVIPWYIVQDVFLYFPYRCVTTATGIFMAILVSRIARRIGK